MNPLQTRTLPDLLRIAINGYRALGSVDGPDAIDIAECRYLADELERRLPRILEKEAPTKKYWWVSYSTLSRLGRTFNDTVTEAHPFLLFDDWDEATHGLPSLVDFHEITEEEYKLHRETR